ncbi:MAG: ABC transporter ATP-binding protein [Eubacterium sp.]|nr:ABC transporter ATP-binding protein [Eubacterium sp.]
MLKTLSSYIREFKKDSLMTPVYMILEVVMEMVIPLLMASIIDDGVEKSDIRHIYMMGALMIVAAFIGLFAGVMGGKYGARASAGFAKNLREGMFVNIQNYSFANIDKFSTAGLVTRLTTDVTNLQNAYQMILRMCVRAPFSLIIAMIMSFFISPKLACVYLVAVFVLGGFLALITVNAYQYFSAVFEKYDELNASVQENISAIRVVKAYVREDYEIGKFQKACGNLYLMFVKAENIIAYNAPAMMITIYSCILGISWLGAKMIVLSNAVDLQTGDLMSLLTYCMNILMSLMMLSMAFVMITMSSASAKRIAEVLQEESTLSNPPNPDGNVPDGSISFVHVDFSYSGASQENHGQEAVSADPEAGGGSGSLVLSDINLEIRSGETIGIIGGTGSSKSSLVSLVSRLYDATGGSVKVGGKDVRSYDLETLRNEVSVVLQKNVLFSGTIYENLRWGDLNASDEECQRACRLACADEFIEAMPDGYHTYIEQGGSNVSGGQKQRLCIARALLKKPKILILDDSTSAVDTATDAKIRKAFAQEIPGTTKLIIAQRISSVQHADRIIVLDRGKVNGFGTHEELLENNAIYREVYESQTGGGGDFDEHGGEG